MTIPTIKQLADRIFAAVINRGMSPQHLATLTKLDERTVRKVVGGADCKLSTLVEIADKAGLAVVVVPKERARAIRQETAESKWIVTWVENAVGLEESAQRRLGRWAK